MDDLISRQDAIDYFFRPYSNEETYSNIEIERVLKQLPSAQPEIIRCGDCKHWDKPHGWNGFCCKNDIPAEADDFCSWAERKEE